MTPPHSSPHPQKNRRKCTGFRVIGKRGSDQWKGTETWVPTEIPPSSPIVPPAVKCPALFAITYIFIASPWGEENNLLYKDPLALVVDNDRYKRQEMWAQCPFLHKTKEQGTRISVRFRWQWEQQPSPLAERKRLIQASEMHKKSLHLAEGVAGEMREVWQQGWIVSEEMTQEPMGARGPRQALQGTQR